MAAAKGSTPWNKGHRSPKPELTASLLLEFVKYEPETGNFYWLKRHSTSKPGVIGNITPKGYVRISICGKKWMAHRLAWLYMTGEWPKQQIDHIDGDRSNNRLSNLRDATPLENSRNRHAPYQSGHRLNLSDAERVRRAVWMRTIRRAHITKEPT